MKFLLSVQMFIYDTIKGRKFDEYENIKLNVI